MERPWLKEYPKGVPTDIDFGDYSSLVDIMSEGFNQYRERPAFANMGTTLSFEEIDRKSRDFAAYLQQELRLEEGSRVAIMLPNLLQYPIVLFGILRAKMTAVNVNPLYTSRELLHQVNDAGVKTIIILENFAHTLQVIIDKTEIQNVITTEIGDLLHFPKNKIVNFVVKKVKRMVPAWRIPNSKSLNKVLNFGAGQAFIKPEINRDDIAFLQYTGGTTGVAKGAILTHGNILANVIQARFWIGNELKKGEEIIITPLPLYHIFSLTANCLVFCSIGALNVLITNPRDFPAFIKELGNWPFTAITGVNTLFGALLNNAEFSKLDFSHLKLSLGGGMAVTRSIAEQWKATTGVVLLEAYGLTETSPAACINPVTLSNYNGYIGLPISSTLVTILDEKEKQVPLGERGELCIKGPQVTQGYWNLPEETKNMFTKDGWLKTGDVAVMNEQGYFKIVDRKKDMILVSGFNVYPNEIEDVASSHDGVLEVAAIGVPDLKSGEVVKLFVVKKDSRLTEKDLMEYCRQNLTGYKRPRYIEFKSDLPKTNVGKILRRALREDTTS